MASALSVSTSLVAARADADVAAQCVRESERAQVFRDEGKLLEARDLFRSCGREECPRLVRRDCTEFAADVERRVPSVVLAARDERGNDLTQVRVTIDAKPFAADLGGRSLPVDPGLHVFHFEADGRKPFDVTLLVREGEKNRAIDAALPALEAAPAPVAPVAPVPPRPHAPEERGGSGAPHARSGVPTMTWILGGVAILGGTAFGVLTFGALEEAKDLERSCSPRCSDAQIEPVESKFLIGRIAGGVGAAAAIGALLFYAFGRESSVAGLRAAPMVTAGGGGGLVGAAF
jgi:hypothetical protein